MSAEVTTTNVVSFELALENTEDASDTVKRTISFDVLPSTNEEQITTAANLFAQASVNTVFQPTNWRDTGGALDVYKITSIKPMKTEKTVAKYEDIIPA